MSKGVVNSKTGSEKAALFDTGATSTHQTSLTDQEIIASFDEHAVAIAKRQYFMPEDKDLLGMFRRVSNWVASPEHGEHKRIYAEAFYDLMTSKRFCPGGRVLAGAGTQHGNVLNCFVQDGSPDNAGSNEWVTRLATKLALVTKVGGGNGLCLDPIAPKRDYTKGAGQLYLTIAPAHADYEKVKTGTYMDLVHGKYVTKGYRYASFIEQSDVPAALPKLTVGDSVDKIWQGGSDMIMRLLDGQDVLLDLSGLRPEGTPVNGSGGNSSGPSSFAVEVFDNFAYWASLGGADYAGPVATLRYVFAPTLRVIRQGGTRRGAGMATMSITHSDINDFITSKDLEREQTEGDISTFNISVLVTDKFMQEAAGKKSAALMTIADHAWQTGEPGLIYIDRINEQNPMREALGDIKSTNPCGEIPLYAGEPCDLGAINLAAYVRTPKQGMKGFDVEGFQADVRTCIRFLDNVLEVNKFALEDNRQMSLKLRRLGLGVMGLADALIMMGYRYDDEKGRNAVAQMIGELRDNATEATEQLAKERGAFPGLKDSAVKTERRNVAVLTVAPTGTTSMLMGVSSGVEPVFAPFVFRKIGDSYASLIHPLFQELLECTPPHADYSKDDKWDLEKVVQAVQDNHGSVQGLDFIPDDVKAVLICAHDISPDAHVRMQGVVQSSFDGGGKMIANSISKTINMPNEATVEDVYRAYSLAFETGCKGITVYRDGSRQFQVLSTKAEKKEDQKSFKDDTTTSQAPVIVTPPVTAPSTLPKALTASRSEYLPGEPLFDRPGRLSGFTDVVKLMLPNGEKRGFYVTVNSQDGLPAEVFIVSGKAGDEANADSEALGRMVSIALQYGVPAEVVVKTLRGINGGMYGTYQGRMAASKADLIAIALETAGVENTEKTRGGKSCPECGGKHLRYEEGCMKCEVCGYSKCG
jgi:ribonucleoside-diphosphate reductase alpha chain